MLETMTRQHAGASAGQPRNHGYIFDEAYFRSERVNRSAG